MKPIKNLILIFLFTSLAFGCASSYMEDTKKECEVQKYGTVTVSNSSSNPYDIYVDGIFKIRLEGGKITTPIKVQAGNGRKLYAKQVSGYLFVPTEKEHLFNVVQCSDYSWQVP